MDQQEEEAKTYEVVSREGVGRCLVAARAIEAGELILKDWSAAAGPKEQQVEPTSMHFFFRFNVHFQPFL